MKVATNHPPAQGATPVAVWRAYQGVSTDAIDENSLIQRHLPLVRNVIERIKINLTSHVDADDLYSVGITSLMAAVRHYDPERDRTFDAYAAMRIRDAILNELRRMDWYPLRAQERCRKLKNAINEVEQKCGRVATDPEVRAALGLSEREYAVWLEESRPATFIDFEQDASSNDDGSALLPEQLTDDTDVTGRDNLENAELLQLLTQRIAELPDIQRKILAMYYFEHMRLAEIAATFDLTESRICQIHAQTILSLRARMERARNR